MSEYLIPKGSHGRLHFPKFYFGKTKWLYQIWIDPDCWTGTRPDHISKIVGVGFWPWHHVESLRLGWMEGLLPQTFDLYFYYYLHGVRFSQKWKTVSSPGAFKFGFERCIQGIRVFNDGATQGEMDTILGVDWSWISYKLFPYYGGTGKAPQSMGLSIIEL